MRLVFATHNTHKAIEVQKMVPDAFEIITLTDLNILDEIPETGQTLQANALIKARFIHQKLGYNCFADDTGLEVEALNGEPGVYSARYAGIAKNNEANITKLLNNLSTKENRRARFVTCICLFWLDEMFVFEGELKGTIIHEKIGTNGFGYDPVFVPDGYDITLAQMDLMTKNLISHRGKAFKKMAEFLLENKG
ncbi:MAG: RdgB/HAM1 family non-canonical purine NTP pyrophosphatase [Bacteroidetes bacterium]|nr:MAG: RdgB/HAM1 family non-canonical purine NTP pyrophosphatase [Bacteroidota bacterium]